MRDLIFAAAALAGFIFEWRRQARADQREQELERRVAELEGQVANLAGWRDRTARAQ